MIRDGGFKPLCSELLNDLKRLDTVNPARAVLLEHDFHVLQTLPDANSKLTGDLVLEPVDQCIASVFGTSA